MIDRTTVTSWLRVPTGYLPDALKRAQSVLNLAVPVFNEQGLAIGPIPGRDAGRSLANFDPLPPKAAAWDSLAHDKQVVAAVFKLVHDSARAAQKRPPTEGPPEGLCQISRRAIVRATAISQDYVVNRGHYFGAKLSDADKNALIAFLKTF